VAYVATGAGRALLVLDPLGRNSTRVTLIEQITEGPLLALRNKINDLILHHRTREALRRLADLAAGGRTDRHSSAAPS
jgi:hypothetical protein